MNGMSGCDKLAALKMYVNTLQPNLNQKIIDDATNEKPAPTPENGI